MGLRIFSTRVDQYGAFNYPRLVLSRENMEIALACLAVFDVLQIARVRASTGINPGRNTEIAVNSFNIGRYSSRLRINRVSFESR